MTLLGSFIVPHPPLIIPEIGRGDEAEINSTIESYHKVGKKIASLNPDTIIVASPHSIMYSDYIHISPGKGAKGDFGQYGRRNISFKVKYDEELVEAIEYAAEVEDISGGTLGEKNPALDHGTMIPLYFINQYIKDYKIIRIGQSGLSATDHYNMGKLIRREADKLGRKIVFIASGDLSHKLKEDGPYGFAQEGVDFDKKIVDIMRTGEFLRFMEIGSGFQEKAAECGLRAFIMMAGALDGRDVDIDFMSYEGPFGVGYAVSSYKPLGSNEERRFDLIYEEKQLAIAKEKREEEDEYVKLARHAIENYVKSGIRISIPDDLPGEMINNKAGVFVTIKKQGELRGCIGTISPVTSSIAQEILRNSISAAMEDPRFAPVSERELPQLVYSVDVLGQTEKIESLEELDVNRYGVIVSSGHKRGLLLPNLEGVNTVDQQIDIARRKAGITRMDKLVIERFEVVRHH